jgi:lysozyme
MTRAIPEAAREIVREFEGYKAKAYKCPAGVWTVGYGHTGPEIVAGLEITKRQGELFLTEDLVKAAKRIEARIGSIVRELTPNQYAALLSFVFNLGAGDWTLWKRLKARDFDGVPAQLARFVNAGGKKLPGLVRRRNAEIELWSRDEPGTAPDVEVNSAHLRQAIVETPPAPAEKPANTPVIAAALSAAGGVPVAAKSVTDALEPYSEASPWIGQAVALVATVAAGAAVLVLVLQWLQRKAAKR